MKRVLGWTLFSALVVFACVMTAVYRPPNAASSPQTVVVTTLQGVAAPPVAAQQARPVPVANQNDVPVQVQQQQPVVPAGNGATPMQTQWRIGDWTPERGADIARRALRWVGTPYAWAGGNVNGPTRGVAVDYASRNDGNVIGFDCSGLVLNAMAPYRALTHYAATQYSQAGSVHPALNQLMPGDLLFWSSDGTVAGIHHVAIYLGGGKIVQAPYSGSYVQVTGIYRLATETIGTTRPLT